MALPASGALSLTMILGELQTANSNRSYPISLGDADVRSLAGRPSGAISISDLYGKSVIAQLNIVGNSDSNFANSQFGSGSLSCRPSVAISGGVSPYTVQWSVVSTSGNATLSNVNSPTCMVSSTYTANSSGSASMVLKVIVTDSQGSSKMLSNISASLMWEGNL